MTLRIQTSERTNARDVARQIGEAIHSRRTISDVVAGSIASWYAERDETFARLDAGKAVTYDEFMWSMLALALDGSIEDAELICLDHLYEWATLKATDKGAA